MEDAKNEEIYKKVETKFLNGKVKTEAIFNKHGALHGLYREFYSFGGKKLEKNYNNGVAHGKEKRWFENGKLEKKLERDNDKLPGKYQEFYVDGTLKEEINYKNSDPYGQQRYWYSNGKLRMEYFYGDIYNKEDEEYYLDGKQQEFFEDGQISNSRTYKNGTLVGMEYTWYQHGIIQTEDEWLDENKSPGEQKQTGKSLSYYKDGTCKINKYYKNGKIDGKWEKFYSNKQLCAECEYIEGKLVKTNQLFNREGKDYMLPEVISKDNLIENKSSEDLMVWKAGKHDTASKEKINVYIKIKVPANVRRVVSLVHTFKFKVRIESGIVMEIVDEKGNTYPNAYSFVHSDDFEYIVGATIIPDGFNNNPLTDCGQGIHVHKYKEDCKQWFGYG